MTMLTQDRLKQLISYDPETGNCYWKVNLRGPVKAGMIVGNAMKGGYRQTQVEGKKYLVHVLIWLYMTGEWPSKEVEHKDRNGGNNVWSNLRLATTSQNQANQSLSIANKSGYKGVFKLPNGKFLASIGKDGKVIYLGKHSTLEEAAAAYAKAAKEYFGEFAHPAAQ